MSEAQARTRLLDFKKQLQAGQADFAALAREFSQDGSAAQGGDLGWASPGMFVPEFEAVMNRLAPGEISEPLVSRFGVHLIQLLERRKVEPEPRREQRELVRNQLREKKLDEAYAHLGAGRARPRLCGVARAAAVDGTELKHGKHIARKRFGQHFLTDGGIIDAIVQAIDPQPGQRMVEIGPGLAALTQPLVERLGTSTVIELDRDLAQRLRSHGQLHGDRVGCAEGGLSAQIWRMPHSSAGQVAGGRQPALQHLHADSVSPAGLCGRALKTSTSCCKKK